MQNAYLKKFTLRDSFASKEVGQTFTSKTADSQGKGRNLISYKIHNAHKFLKYTPYFKIWLSFFFFLGFERNTF